MLRGVIQFYLELILRFDIDNYKCNLNLIIFGVISA